MEEVDPHTPIITGIDSQILFEFAALVKGHCGALVRALDSWS